MKAREWLSDVREQVFETWKLSDAPKFITKHTFLKGLHYSFQDHEFQEKIAADDAQAVNTQKCSQIGMSELTARWNVAVVNMIPDFSSITTFPFSGDAADFAKTRIDPFIESSPRLRAAVNKNLNNSEIKQFGSSFMYFRGTNGKTQAISIPADLIISDEIDRSDPHVLSQYHSRLTHSPWQLRRNFSTPTIPGYGIALEMASSERFHNMCKCCHCNHQFVPNYFEHVRIPGFNHDLRTITKHTLPKTRYLEARMMCPNCGKEPSLLPQYREWVSENRSDNFSAHGYFVSPFDAPNIIKLPFLIESSTKYARYSEFVNQNLGLAEQDNSEALTLSDLNDALAVNMDLRSTEIHALGIDVGLTCTLVVGRMTRDVTMIVVHRERCPISMLDERKQALQREYRVAITVIDSLPYTDTVQRMQKFDKNVYGAVYSTSKKLEAFAVKMFEGDESEGKLPIHTVQINRDKALDTLLGMFKRKEVLLAPMGEEENELYCKQLLDMRRVQVPDENHELSWTWVKSKAGDDHYHHATLYLYIACMLRGTISRQVVITGVPLVQRMSMERHNRAMDRLHDLQR